MQQADDKLQTLLEPCYNTCDTCVIKNKCFYKKYIMYYCRSSSFEGNRLLKRMQSFDETL